MPKRRRSIFLRLVLLVLLAVGVGLLFRQGYIPWKYSPLPALSLESPGGLFLDWQLVALRTEPQLCRQVLKPPAIHAELISDSPIRNDCGWINAVRMSEAGAARISVDKVSCEVAAAFALWMMYEVQPLAVSIIGQRVASVQHMGTYSCRNIVGNKYWKDLKSEHATANAIDIAGFTFADGRRISVQRNWSGDGPEAVFLKAVHQRACRYFRVALGPDFNAAHHDHFHLDRGVLWTCQ